MTDTKPDQFSVILLARTMIRIFRSNDIVGLAQQIAYNILFSVAPLMIFLTAVGSLVTQRVNSDADNPVEPVLNWLDENLPAEAAAFLKEPVGAALSTSPGFLLSIGGLLTLWSAKNAIAAIMKGLNVTYGIEESRSWLRVTITAIVLTIGLAIAIIVSAAFQILGTSLGQDIADWLHVGTAWETTISWLQWPITAVLATFVIVLIHRFAPDIKAPLRWLLPGAALSIIAFALATLGLQVYFSHFAGFSEAYGVFGAVLAFIFWLFVVSVVILAGGILNAALFEMFPPAREALASYSPPETRLKGRLNAVRQMLLKKLPDQPNPESPARP